MKYWKYLTYSDLISFKVKGTGYSLSLQNEQLNDMFIDRYNIYERVWDEVDYIGSLSHTDDFSIMTNLVRTPNQKRAQCPEDYLDSPSMICGLEYRNKDILGT